MVPIIAFIIGAIGVVLFDWGRDCLVRRRRKDLLSTLRRCAHGVAKGTKCDTCFVELAEFFAPPSPVVEKAKQDMIDELQSLKSKHFIADMRPYLAQPRFPNGHWVRANNGQLGRVKSSWWEAGQFFYSVSFWVNDVGDTMAEQSLIMARPLEGEWWVQDACPKTAHTKHELAGKAQRALGWVNNMDKLEPAQCGCFHPVNYGRGN